MKCKKSFCMKMVNPDKPEAGYFGEPFVYDENWLACLLCPRKTTKGVVYPKSEPVVTSKPKPVLVKRKIGLW